MTDNEINIAIAKACGWELTPNEWWYEAGEYLPFAPDYCNDLNEMHEAEATMGDPQLWLEYEDNLAKVMNHVGWDWHATAAQRARAFLETLGLWDNGSA